MTSPALDLSFPADHVLADLVSAELHDLGVTAVHETGTDTINHWRVCFASIGARDTAAGVLLERLGPSSLTVQRLEIEDEDWAARSQATLRHIRVGRIIVAPPWDVPPPQSPDHVVVIIKPSMGFGTGHHATTRLCLQLLQGVDCAGKRIADVGTGSGVLAIAAAKLGASRIIAVDVDPDALLSARENVALNCDAISDNAVIELVEADFRTHHFEADVLVANLTGAVLVNSAGTLVSRVEPGGSLLLSGFQDGERDRVLAAFSGMAECDTVRTEENWNAAVMRVNSRSRQSAPHA